MTIYTFFARIAGLLFPLILFTFLCCSVLSGLYLTFLLLLSFALLYGSTKEDPTRYKGNADGLRMVCEIFVVLCIVAYIADEINEIEK